MDSLTIHLVDGSDSNLLEAARSLFRDYHAEFEGDTCFYLFEEEVQSLPGIYQHPTGALWILTYDNTPAGCIALRALSASECEMKRLFVRSPFRGLGLGKHLVQWVIDQARTLEFESIKLDSLDTMEAAQRLYEEHGFVDCAPYNDTPADRVRFMTLRL